jgi:hypothetical protein
LGRRSTLAWKFGDLVEAAGIRQNLWRARTGISPFDHSGRETLALA